VTVATTPDAELRAADGAATQVRVVIVGAGFSGIGLGIKLKEAGLDDFVILEKADGVGGVWRQNRYPGAACDIPSHLYSFSFEPRVDWPERYARQTDILAYLEDCARSRGLYPHIRFGTEVAEARWDEASGHWIVRTRDGHAFAAQALVTATGQLSMPVTPRLPGLASFAGTAFHSAEWRGDYDLVGKRVAVIGTGASAIQVVPAIAPVAERIFLFQRSAPYVLPRSDGTYGRWQAFLFRHLAGWRRLYRLKNYLSHEMNAFAFVTLPSGLKVLRPGFLRHLRRCIADPELRRRLTPVDRLGCKRILLSNDYYAALTRPNVELIAETIRETRADSIVTVDSAERKIDCIIFATGFAATEFLAPMKIVGREGKDLRRSWEGGAEAYLGITVAGFPNLFMLYGPNTNLAHNSLVYMIESEIRYVMACLKRLARDDVRTLEVRGDVQARFNAQIQERMPRSQWATGCSTWYLTASGKNTVNWPGYSFAFRMKTRAPKWEDFAVQ
jgi:cation diffusion facilitator CzcD-associated flavoprotein CzcO